VIKRFHNYLIYGDIKGKKSDPSTVVVNKPDQIEEEK
jgi:hypothetical protein